MTKEQLARILDSVQERLRIKDDEVFFNYLDTSDQDEIERLSQAVEEEFGIDKDEFTRALMTHLIILAKPWAKEGDIIVQ